MAVGIAVSLMPTPSAAQVFEISDNGAVLVRDGAGAATWQAVDESSEPGNASELVLPAAALSSNHRFAAPERYARAVEYAAAAANVSPALLSALVWQESRWNPAAVSSKGAVGLTQLMPGTARELGVDSADPLSNLVGGARYLRQQLDAFDGNLEKALAAYNSGPGRVRRVNGVPRIPETQAYVKSIVQRMAMASGTNL